MRLPLVSELDSRDGESNKDSRLTNVLAEIDSGSQVATIRPALETMASMSGNGNGLVAMNGVLVSVFGTTLGFGDDPVTVGTVLNGHFDFAQSPL